MSLKPVLPGNMVAVPASGGGSGTPQLPTWMFDGVGGAPDSGCFQANSTDPTAINQLNFSPFAESGLDMSGMFAAQPYSSLIMITSLTTGKSYVFDVVNGWGVADPISGAANPLQSADTSALSGEFAVTMLGVRTDSTAFQITNILNNSSITPIADGTYFGITFKNGIAVSAATPVADGTTSPVTSVSIGAGGAIAAIS